MKRYGFSAKERIKSKNDFKNIYTSGRLIISSDKKIKAIFIVEQNSNQPGVQIAAAVHHKVGIAVWRNRAKRLIREAYRLNKHILSELTTKNNVLLKIVFSTYVLNEKKNKNLKLNDIVPGVTEIMLKLKSSI